MYIYHLPYEDRRQLCYILDQNNKWEELGGSHMKFDVVTMEGLRKEIFRGSSPSNELLNLWGHQNHTVLELFILLSRMQHYQAMNTLKKFVDKKYHVLIKNGTDHLYGLIGNMQINDSKVPHVNFCNNSEKILNVEKVIEALSRDNNESTVENNRPFLKPKSPLPNFNRAGTSRMLTATDISCVAESAGATPQIQYEELQKSTNNWDPSAILGKGGFGTVYKGTWKCTQVAIKRLEQKEDKPEYHSEQIKQSITELHCLNAYRHDNILPLYGYSIGGQHPCLVYQYMSGGSLEHRLRIKDINKVLTWLARLNIAIGVARGLQFLHTTLHGEKPLIHGDIKSANILLDPCDQPRIGDFGLAREGPHSNYTHIMVSRIHGTRPYLPDEFLRAKIFSTKVDTYSFGIVLFELATCLSAYSDKRKNRFLKDHVVEYAGNILDLKDSRAEKAFDDYYMGLIDIGKLCVSRKPKDRPEMVAVLIALERIFTKENS